MNNIQILKGTFKRQKNPNKPGAPKLPKGSSVTSKKIQGLIDDLIEIKNKDEWNQQKILSKFLVSAYYIKIAAKSNRIQGFFGNNANKYIVGAKFDDKPRHIITYFVSPEIIDKAIANAKESINILDNYFNSKIDSDTFNKDDALKIIDFQKYKISKSNFRKHIVDALYIEKYDVETASLPEKESAIVSLYETGQSPISLLQKLGIKVYNKRLLNNDTLLLDATSIAILMEQAPYLVSMATLDMTTLVPNDFVGKNEPNNDITIPSPTIEPTIGVIDTPFNKNVYFNKWVTYYKSIDSDINIMDKDYFHGTEVSSIIVDGPTLNPNLDDGCGRFRVKHFGVATQGKFSSFSVIQSIKEAVISNPDIHVWNLSLGSNAEVNHNFISAEGAFLDEIQCEYNVIFVIAGTNKAESEPSKHIGAPADSINSFVVNSVGKDKKPTKYSREGIVLSFFTKPDASYYGGDANTPIYAVSPNGISSVAGTSFSAPWIARKLAFMIEILNMSRESAKALLIDSAIGWHKETNHQMIALKGHGVIPINIKDIVSSKSDEIKFLIEGSTNSWETYNYNVPVPVVDNKQPFLAKATLCYFPKCSRNQGVDYTNTELDLYFGRITDDNKVKSIDDNIQIDNEPHYLKEKDARKRYRKWDNVKHIGEIVKPKSRPRKIYSNQMWGISLKTKHRLTNSGNDNNKFGIIITLKELNGINRLLEFTRTASARGWIVSDIDIQKYLSLHNQAETDVPFE